MKKILFCFGTRPEVVKIAPLIHEARSQGFVTEICLTGQHKEMLNPFMTFFDLKENYSLSVMKEGQTLSKITSLILEKMDEVLEQSKPDFLAVQGDTTSTLSCALSGFYRKIPVLHIEAGLRTFNLHSPFPEEANRQMVSTFASYNFCPTQESAKNLADEKRDNIFITGNTSIDALRVTKKRIKELKIDTEIKSKYSSIDFTKKIILVTCHRRENHGAPLKRIIASIKDIAKSRDFEFVFPVHLNPNIKNIVENELGNIPSVHLLPPLDYVEFVWFMSTSYLLLTDSGGVQEEGPYFKKPVLILRDDTERPEILTSGQGKLVGSDSELIKNEIYKLLIDPSYYQSFLKETTPYGDGFASQKIVKILKGF